MEYKVLSNGVQLPMMGYGTFQLREGEECRQCVARAWEAGYCLFDTAASYGNEKSVGAALRDLGVPREEYFVTTKLWVQDAGFDNTLRAFERSLENLGLDSLDLYLIHQPFGDVTDAWKALEEEKAAGKIKSIGVSNMTPAIWKEFVLQFQTLPAMNQVECNPFFQQRQLRELLAEGDVKIEAYQPLGHGDNTLLSHPEIVKLAEKYGKNSGQIILRFEVQDGLIVLPKSTNPERIAGNLEIFDFALSEAEMETLRALDTGKGHHDPGAPGVVEMLLQNFKVHD